MFILLYKSLAFHSARHSVLAPRALWTCHVHSRLFVRKDDHTLRYIPSYYKFTTHTVILSPFCPSMPTNIIYSSIS
jgi:hypothetical protein